MRVPAWVTAERLAICRGCDHYRASDARYGKVDGCGWLAAKSALATESCPIGRWGPWTPGD